MTLFVVRPLDYAFFGAPGPQSAGETHFMRTLFPPPPRAFQGLVRTRLLSQREPKLDLNDRSAAARAQCATLVGESDRLPDKWQIQAPVPISWNEDERAFEPWLPTPRFVRTVPAVEGGLPARTVVAEGVRVSGNALLGSKQENQREQGEDLVIGVPGFADRPLGKGWLSANNMLWALGDEGARFRQDGAKSLPPHVVFERRSGVEIDPKKGTAVDRQLYTLEQLRFDGKGGFLGGFEGPLDATLSAASLTSGVVPFGRWNRLAELSPVGAVARLVTEWDRLVSGAYLPVEPVESQMFWMVLWTPTNLSVGTQDSDRAGVPSRPEIIGGTRLTYHASCLGKEVTLGGFSIAEQKARPNQAYVMPGSAWLFSIPGVTPQERGRILRALHAQHVLGPVHEAQMGFGRVLIGTATVQAKATQGETT